MSGRRSVSRRAGRGWPCVPPWRCLDRAPARPPAPRTGTRGRRVLPARPRRGRQRRSAHPPRQVERRDDTTSPARRRVGAGPLPRGGWFSQQPPKLAPASTPANTGRPIPVSEWIGCGRRRSRGWSARPRPRGSGRCARRLPAVIAPTSPGSSSAIGSSPGGGARWRSISWFTRRGRRFAARVGPRQQRRVGVIAHRLGLSEGEVVALAAPWLRRRGRADLHRGLRRRQPYARCRLAVAGGVPPGACPRTAPGGP